LSPLPPPPPASQSPLAPLPPPPPPLTHDTSDDGTDACIFKVYDDCRQDALVIQVVRLLRDAFAAAGLPCYLVPYTVVPSRVGADFAPGGILQVVKHVKSRDQIAKGGAKDLVAHYTACFGAPGSAGYRAAQWAFVRSTAAYAVVCYLMWIKDRHNGNLLVDNQGHVVHIDYGFILGISPGGNLGFETAAFKLTPDMLALMGGLDAPLFATFVDLVVRGFLVARAQYRALADVVCAMADGGTPCFLRHVGDLERFKGRFVLDMTSSEAARYMEKKVLDAAAKWTTAGYDAIQFAQNGIM
jgi:phosphatidylinositol 4-kinase